MREVIESIGLTGLYDLRINKFRLLTILLSLTCCGLAQAAESVTLQLRWIHQFQFAGYYAALEKGFYAAEGLDVEIRAAGPNHPTPLEELESGNAQYGVGNSGLVVAYQQGKPIVALAAIFQRSPNIWLTLEKSQLISLQELASKRLMMTPSVENAELLTLFANEGIDRSKLKIVPSTFDVGDLINGRTDAFNAYATNEPYLLKKQGVSYRIIDPHDYGIDFYSDVLFTTEDEIINNPDRAKAFRSASLKGWAYAMANPKEIIDLIKQRYNVEKSRDHLEFEAAAIYKMMQPDLIEVGHMNPLRWEKISESFVRQGMSSPIRPLDGFIYDPVPKVVPQWLVNSLILSTFIIVIFVSISGLIVRSNQRLRAAKGSLQASEARLGMALAAAKQGWFDLDLINGKIIVSPEYPQLIGYAADEFESDLANWMANIHQEDRPRLSKAFEQCVSTGEPTTMAYRRRSKSGDWVWMESVGKVVEWDAKGGATRMIGIHTDITDRKRLEDEIHELAFYDSLTGLPNRALLSERLIQAIAISRREKRYGALIFLDLDNFKPLNDDHGHDLGDMLLVEAARRLKSCLREIDTAARFGGDEFVVVLSALNQTKEKSIMDALGIAEKISDVLAEPYVLKSAKGIVEHYSTASIGVTLFGIHRFDPDLILRNADSAMYQAKRSGSGRVYLCESKSGSI